MKLRPITLSCCTAIAATCTIAAPAVAASWAPDARVLARDGVRVGWPLRQERTTLRPGTSLTVTVGPAGTSRVAHLADVALLRVTARGVPMSVIGHRRLRSGRYTVKLPAGDGRLYALRLTVARHRWQALVTTPAAATAIEPTTAPSQTSVTPGRTNTAPPPGVDDGTSAGFDPAPIEPPGPQWVDPCTVTTGVSATWRLDSLTAVADALVPDTLTIGPTCMELDGDYNWERQNDDGTWTPWPWPSDWLFTGSATTVVPHQTIHGAVRVPPDAIPGHYRATMGLDADPKESASRFDPVTGRWIYDLTVTAELYVVLRPPTG
jgi:hypothetical protein